MYICMYVCTYVGRYVGYLQLQLIQQRLMQGDRSQPLWLLLPPPTYIIIIIMGRCGWWVDGRGRLGGGRWSCMYGVLGR